MREFLKTKAGVLCVTVFVFFMAFMLHRVVSRRRAAADGPRPTAAVPPSTQPPTARPAAEQGRGQGNEEDRAATLAENAAHLDRYYHLNRGSSAEQDRSGNPVTRRRTANTPQHTGETVETPQRPETLPPPPRIGIRLQGRPAPAQPLSGLGGIPNPLSTFQQVMQNPVPASSPERAEAAAAAARIEGTTPAPRRPKRFNPYGNPIKCELVFTIDSTNESTPFVGLVMEPVYNNGQLIIPAGAEFHGVARPDRLRDRIFSGDQWVLVFPRERNRPNGRQLNVRGVALDRLEPSANGMTWGITDGSYGLTGAVIRNGSNEEIKRFVATAIAAGSQTLQERETDGFGQDRVRNTPRNAVLQGVAANMEKIAADITAELARHGVFIRVPAGRQFYFYPQQIIDPDVADISQDIATVK